MGITLVSVLWNIASEHAVPSASTELNKGQWYLFIGKSLISLIKLDHVMVPEL
jgi:hypothetical protein